MVVLILRAATATGLLISWDSWFVELLVYFVVATVCGYICGRIAQAGGMNTTIYVFIGSFFGSSGIFLTLFMDINTYLGVLFGLIGIAITFIIYITSRDKTLDRVELPRAAPQYAPFESAITQNDIAFGSLGAPNQPQPEEFAQGAYMCPCCNANVPNSDDICWNCGELLRRQSISRLCPTCHQENPAQADSCSNCGCALDGPTFMKQ
ncbi:MAG: zinc ribbon domain-containing protein [Actinobacteria bacterium]|nr:zinc ribbon domain-containing protein [Actinomycetota bacterium]